MNVIANAGSKNPGKGANIVFTAPQNLVLCTAIEQIIITNITPKLLQLHIGYKLFLRRVIEAYRNMADMYFRVAA